jgi:hypothetical protein
MATAYFEAAGGPLALPLSVMRCYMEGMARERMRQRALFRCRRVGNLTDKGWRQWRLLTGERRQHRLVPVDELPGARRHKLSRTTGWPRTCSRRRKASGWDTAIDDGK